jgi:hypothetical protein
MFEEKKNAFISTSKKIYVEKPENQSENRKPRKKEN